MLFNLLKMGWWLGLSMFPLALLRTIDKLRTAIGCPPLGDCYQPGWSVLLDLQLMIGLLVVFVVPVCLWHVAGNGWQLWRRLRGQ